MRTAELTRSDPAFVGLMIRCGDPDLELLPVVIPPLPPQAKPNVTLAAGSQTLSTEGTITPPGSAILVPSAGTAAMLNALTRAPRVDVGIRTDDTTINGSVALDGVSQSLASLRAACAAQ